ncbi:hypothetical protein EYZ11_006846 [Aspergillus tanneri]|uniref:CUE domain-containing protein n=1 Tax=Aspergillus tanneri TaxID=1220188 RepID=A0A4S3JES5_9EURO|nr:uncharacterized protein ATNIH1004_005899 [Aspergillus tanneri]KAA8647209.1 hypothetical protein ATNIH1004_005899 [Aspergillus tanneri]THC93670.1 hypothetical protein EYZ11_006846 [Aspergillus tanneri]
MANLPLFAPVPPPEVQSTIPPTEWELYMDAWILLLGLWLETSDAQFSESAPKDESAIVFLTTYYAQLSVRRTSGLHTGTKAKTLRKLCFLLTRRYLLEVSTSPPELLEWKYLGDICCSYPSSAAAKKLLSDVWSKHEETISSSLEKAKSTIMKQLTVMNPAKASGIISDIRLLTTLASVLPPSGQVLMAGSDYLDTFCDAYQMHWREDIRRILVANIYVGLVSLLKGPKPNLSLLLDQLFSLKASAGVGTSKTRKEATLLSDVICSSDLLVRLERYILTYPHKRGQDLVSSLHTYQSESKVFHHRYQKQKKQVDKGKGRASDLPRPEDLHIHKMSLVTQVQDLFPDLGSGYIVRLLDQFNDNPETVIAHLLDDSIPAQLQSLNKSEQLSQTVAHYDPLPPRATPLELTPEPEPVPTRKNVFDQDVDLAELARSNADGKLRFGRANPDLTADAILNDRSQHATNKAAIMSALATFDSDDDERDDTYDVADVGGTVDAMTANPEAEADAEIRNRKALLEAEQRDLTLFRAYKDNSGLFARDSATRRSQPRTSLKRETGMTDEAIEGWAVMLNRDPKRLSKLESKFSVTAGAPGGVLTQPELRPTAYRKPGDVGSESDTDEPSGSTSRGRGGSTRGPGRGGRRGGGGGRRGGANAGGAASGGQNTTVSRQRKEENKSSRANHNRRQQRAKKVARAGGMAG